MRIYPVGRPRHIVCLVLALIMVFVSSCTQEVTKYNYFRITVDGQQTLGISAKDKLIRAVVVFFHDFGGNEFSITSSDDHLEMIGKLVDAGFAVVSSNAGGDSWGNPASQHNYLYVGGMAAEHYGTENLYFLADSMGAIAAINLLATGPTLRVLGLAAINPVLNMDGLPAKYQPTLTAAYPQLPRGLANPMNPMALPVDSLSRRKIRFYVNSDDTLVPADKNALAFKDRFGSVADISTVDCSGSDTNASCFNGEDVLTWFTDLEKRNAA